MRCSCCGQKLDDGATTCTRCAADLTHAAKRRRLVISVVYATIAIVLVALLIFVVLSWHEAQMLS